MANRNSPLCVQGMGESIYDASPFSAKMNLFKFSGTRKCIQKSRSNISGGSSQNSLNPFSSKKSKKQLATTNNAQIKPFSLNEGPDEPNMTKNSNNFLN